VLLTAPLGISLITIAIGKKEPLILETVSDPELAPLALRVLFVFTCAAIWVGLASSLQEIVKESAIYMRERLVNLGLFAYLGAKQIILSGLALVQTLLMSIVILIGFKSPEPDLIPWFLGLVITIFLTLSTSIGLGLMVSASVKNITQANSALPLLLIPQIIFSGVLFNMEGIGKYISWLMLSRWSVGAYGSLIGIEKLVAPTSALNPCPSPIKNPEVYTSTWGNLALNWGMLILLAAIYWAITFWIQKRKDIF
ncbi:MAG: ABC transporter permease, partial [Microcystaceae cyanobacterium]